MIKKIIPALLSAGAITALLLFGADISQGVRCGLAVCGEVVIPSLFPFMVLANFIAYGNGADYLSKPFSGAVKWLFRLPDKAVASVLLSFIGGYPVGAALASKLYTRREITLCDAECMLTFAVNASPAMVIFAVGNGMLGSAQLGALLYGVHILAAVINGILFSRILNHMSKSKATSTQNKTKKCSDRADEILYKSASNDNAADKYDVLPPNLRKNIADRFVEATADASAAMISVCGCVMLFAGIIASLGKWSFLAPFAEVTVGCAAAVKFGLPAVAATLGFGGFSVIMQVMSLSKGIIRPSVLFFSRINHAVLSYLICKIALFLLPSAAVAVISTAVPSAAKALSITAPVSASLMLLASVVMCSAAATKKQSEK